MLSHQSFCVCEGVCTAKWLAMYKQYNLKDETFFKMGTHALRAFLNRKSSFEVCVTFHMNIRSTTHANTFEPSYNKNNNKHANLINIL